jgi:hypothetical protein
MLPPVALLPQKRESSPARSQGMVQELLVIQRLRAAMKGST